MQKFYLRLIRHGFLALAFVLASLGSFSQTIVKGKVTDAGSGDPIPFANIIFKGTTVGTTTDFDGNFAVRANIAVDSIIASYLGYQPKTKKVKMNQEQVINFQLDEVATHLQEVVVDAGENPAYAIMRNVVRNKNNNDKRRLLAYEYDTYTKIEVDVDNISEAFRKRKIVRKITQVLDSIDRIAGEDGKPILPLFISESVSKFYYRDKPELKFENILKSKVTGVGIDDGTLVTQFIGTSFQEYNFYQNWLNIVSKDFASPIADGWRIYYNYDLTDSVYIGDHFCYRLDFTPKSEQDLAFTGTIWITKDEYALKQIDATVGKRANVNFIEKIRIQQELEPTSEGPWVPVKNRVLIDVGELTKTSAGMLAKFYTSNKNIIVNKPKDPSFYKTAIRLEENATMFKDDRYWDTLRHEPLSETEKNVYKMIDTLQHIPVVKTYTDIVRIVVDGFYATEKIDLGPYISTVAFNNIEGWRVQGGFKTNINFSNKWEVRGSLGYGFKDERIKYSAQLLRILSRDRWTTVSVRVRSDLGRLGVDDETLADNYLFLAAQRFGIFRRGYYFNETRFNFKREFFKGFSQRVALRHSTFRPTFNFGYYQQPENPDDPQIAAQFENAEIILESRFARDEIFIQDDNERITLGTTKWPIITLRYTHGLKGVWGSDFQYDKIRFSVTKRIKFGPLGYGLANASGEYVFNTIPYPLLSLHLGNQTPVFAAVTYNLMNYGEFVSDRFASLQYQHHFEGFLLNRIPLLNRLKWRLVGTSNIIVGGMSYRNQALIATSTSDGQETLRAGFLTHRKPYVELGYGVENIFKFFRVDFIHRLSYLNNPDVSGFGVFVSAQFNL